MPDMGVGEILSVGGPLLGSVLGADAAQSAADTQAGAADRATQAQLQMFNQTQKNLAPWLQQGGATLSQLQNLLSPGPNLTPGVDYNQPLVSVRDGKTYWSDLSSDPAYMQAWNKIVGGAGGNSEVLDPTWLSGQLKQALTPTPDQGSLLKPFTLDMLKESPAYQFNLQQGQKALNQQAAARNMYYAPATLKQLSDYSQGMASNEFQNAYNNYNTTQNQIFNRLFSLSGSGQNAAANLGSIGSQVAGQIGNNITGAGAAQAAGMVGAANAFSGGMSGAYNNYLMQQLLRQSQTPTIPDPGFYSPGNFGGADIGGYGANPY